MGYAPKRERECRRDKTTHLGTLYHCGLLLGSVVYYIGSEVWSQD